MIIDPGCTPQVGDDIEVEHEGKWQEAKITKVENGKIHGEVLNMPRWTTFIYEIGSYRHNWRWSQKRPTDA